MHLTVLRFGSEMIKKYGLDYGKVLEVGSYEVTKGLRHLFEYVSYTGIDVREGPGVDIVFNEEEGFLFQFEYQSATTGEWGYEEFDTVICTEVLEHAQNPVRVMEDIAMVLKRGGYLILTARGVDIKTNKAMYQHDYPHDYWRFMPAAVPLLHEFAGCELLEHREDTEHEGFLSIGRKK